MEFPPPPGSRERDRRPDNNGAREGGAPRLRGGRRWNCRDHVTRPPRPATSAYPESFERSRGADGAVPDWRRQEVTQGHRSLRAATWRRGRRRAAEVASALGLECLCFGSRRSPRPAREEEAEEGGGEGRISGNSCADCGGGGGGGSGGGGERKEEGGAERGGDRDRRGRHHDASPAPSSLRGAARGGDASPPKPQILGLRLGPAARSFRPAACELRSKVSLPPERKN